MMPSVKQIARRTVRAGRRCRATFPRVRPGGASTRKRASSTNGCAEPVRRSIGASSLARHAGRAVPRFELRPP